jgi:peroxiredoxin
MCVNDGAVIKAWAEKLGLDGSMISVLGDPSCKWTAKLGMVMDHSGPVSVLGNKRCKRFAIFFDDGVAKVVRVSEGPDDPSGDNDPSATCVEAMLEVA